MTESSEDKRIIIDEDWKSQVEREREEQRIHGEHEEGLTGHESSMREFPPATFELLVHTLVTQIFASLGQYPDPNSNERTVSLPYAKLNIDLLEVLEEKTRGNLTTEEQTILEESLYHARMLFVSVREALQRQAGVPTEGGSTGGPSKIITEI